jgi:hypothetical protein
MARRRSQASSDVRFYGIRTGPTSMLWVDFSLDGMVDEEIVPGAASFPNLSRY